MQRLQITKIHELAIRSSLLHVVHSLSNKLSIRDAKDKNGNSFLMLAAQYGKSNLVDFFLEKEVSVTLKNKDGFTAAEIAKKQGYIDLYERLSLLEKEVQLVKLGHENTEFGHIKTKLFKHTYKMTIEALEDERSASDLINREPTEITYKDSVEFLNHEPKNAVSDESKDKLSKSSFSSLSCDIEKIIDNVDEQGDWLGGWECEEEPEPPKQDNDFVEKVTNVVSLVNKHRPVDKSQSWDDIEIQLPSLRENNLGRNESQIEKKFPNVYRLLNISLRNYSNINAQFFYSCVDDDQIASGIEMPDCFWEDLIDKLELKFEIDADVTLDFFRYDCEEVHEDSLDVGLVYDFLNEIEDVSDVWERRLQKQFETQDILDRRQEERLGQRMDSALISMRQIIMNIEDESTLKSIQTEVSIDEKSSLYDKEEELIGEDKNNSFLGFVTGVDIYKYGDFPPRPAVSDMSDLLKITSYLCEKESKKIDFQYKRYLFARNQFFLANRRFVSFIVKKYPVTKHISMEDHVQNGMVGLLKAVERYDYRMGFKFSTYSMWWIRQNITREIANDNSTIRIPVHIYETKRKLERGLVELNKKINNKDKKIPSLEDITGLTKKEIKKTERTLQSWVDVDEIDELSIEELNYNEISSMRNPDQIVLLEQNKKLLEIALNFIKPKEAEVVRMRFGLGDYFEHTLEQVGLEMGVTRERIRQIEAKALDKLRQPSKLKILSGINENEQVN